MITDFEPCTPFPIGTIEENATVTVMGRGRTLIKTTDPSKLWNLKHYIAQRLLVQYSALKNTHWITKTKFEYGANLQTSQIT